MDPEGLRYHGNQQLYILKCVVNLIKASIYVSVLIVDNF